MSKLAITGARFLDPEAAPRDGGDGEGAGAALLVEGGRIVERLGPGRGDPGPDWRRVDRAGRQLAPGFLDLHFHGELVAAAPAGFPAALERAAARMLREGTTGFLATTVTAARAEPADVVGALCAAVAAAAEGGAPCLGLHLEGPWISPAAPGAMAPEGIRSFEPGRDREVLERAGGLLRMVTFAPEVPGAEKLVDELVSRGVIAALGHTRAAPGAIADAVARGARHVTHLFNAMGPLHHREPGVPGTVLAEERLTCDLICDGHHVHPAIVRLAARALDGRLLLISDRIDPAEGGSDTTLGRIASAGPGEPWRRDDGTLVGSRLGLDAALRNLRDFAALDLWEAVAACTLRPARLLGIERERGTLRPGARADFAVLDAQGRVVETWLAGRRVWPAS